MKLMTATALAVALGFSAAATAAHGPYGHVPSGPSGFNNAPPTTVAGVRKYGMDDQIVTLKGRLTEYLGHDRYRFTDDTGSIEVELDDDRDWSFIARNELIQISGEIDDDFLSTKIDVEHVVSLESGKSSSYGPLLY